MFIRTTKFSRVGECKDFLYIQQPEDNLVSRETSLYFIPLLRRPVFCLPCATYFDFVLFTCRERKGLTETQAHLVPQEYEEHLVLEGQQDPRVFQ